ncbi:2-amino-4-hydroxy-6-hydroxymethyldihydropteridine diphosphokinase [Lentibacillus sp. N15]|uniref:2-amino-4-hydroxy-6- hydroxymethyldihydropteridine diphosphokinase n=1 Tax=Lentibacillus songyuanensis TaxID=3136161 RepID=UPI0031B9F8A9
MTKAYIALGSNIEPRDHYLTEAITLLKKEELVTVKRQSSVYETKPVGYTEQADFLNMVIQADTTLSATALLDVCQSIEQKLGRKREIRFGPRTVDLDILLYDDEQIESERLIIPHPRMHERAFVLIPLAEIAPDLHVAGCDRSVYDMVQDLSANDKRDVTTWTENDSANE